MELSGNKGTWTLHVTFLLRSCCSWTLDPSWIRLSKLSELCTPAATAGDGFTHFSVDRHRRVKALAESEFLVCNETGIA